MSDSATALDHDTKISKIPEPLNRLEELAHNLYWSWTPEARRLFRMITVTLWRRTEHNPVRMLRDVTPDRLERLAIDPDFLEDYHSLLERFDAMLAADQTSVESDYPLIAGRSLAYFSAEYGLHSSLPIYSGGLGVLAGDHCKTSSDLGLPLTAVGFMYPKGYFEQEITADGTQLAEYKDISIPNSPIERAFLTNGEPVIVSLPLEDLSDLLHLQVWLVRAGRVKLYLIDSDLDTNKASNRDISTRLYGGDKEYRLRQEIALGIGGTRVLRALGLEPDVWHANEGHVAFMLLERLREYIKQGQSFDEALQSVRSTSIFTTHTPVPAGHDAFPIELMDRYFWHYWEDIGIDREKFLDLGRHQETWGEAFNMTVLSLNLTEHRNSVSKRHREVTEDMWPSYITPVQTLTSVTNGVHVPTWIAPEMSDLFAKELGADWQSRQLDAAFWEKVHDIPNDKYWATRQKLKMGLISFILSRVRRKWTAEGMDAALFVPSGVLFDPTILTIGFARRFATYKRATLIFRDPVRLKKILTDPLRPVQLLFSGKAHPADEGGQTLIREIYNFAKDPAFAGQICFLENYSIHIAKNLVRGVDLWMNNPKAPLEASGTSGMKAGINGVPNFSILDGWWIEGCNDKNGWGIPGAETGSQDEQDEQDANAMYEALEQSIIPAFYDKGIDGIPHRWVEISKESIATILPQFSAERMVREYIENLYTPAMEAANERLSA